VLLAPVPYGDADRLVRLTERWPNFSGPRPVSFLNYLDWAQQSTVFERMVAASWGSVTVGDGAQPVYVEGSFVSPGYFDVFGLRAAIGRTFAPEDAAPGLVEPYPRPIGLDVEPSLYVLFAAVVAVLLIACANPSRRSIS
jgi:putative ABC transport system permease protein